MAYRTKAQIESFLADTLHRMDGPFQWAGDEPNSYQKDWDSASVRAVLAAAWTYEQAAGNQAIPLVYRTINEARDDFLCDRTYFFATPRDLKLFEAAGIPQFGIEQKRQLRDYDVVGTSISYPVLSINYIKQLMLSDIPPTWEERHQQPEKWPFVIVGGQLYGAPEVAANIVDCVVCGEVEDEPDNPGIGAVFTRISTFKKSGRWSTDRLSCYADLAREFSWLYFPCFVDVHYAYEDRESVQASVKHLYNQDAYQPSKQVIGYTSKLPGMRLPIVKRFVKDLDAVPGLTNPPLLYVDPGLGSGDAETSRGCPAWSIPIDARVEVAGRGSVRFDSIQPGELIRVGSAYQRVAAVAVHGIKPLVTVRTRQGHELQCTPEHEVYVVPGGAQLSREARDAAARQWVHAEDLQPGDLLLRACGGTVWPGQEVVIEQQCATYPVGRPRADGTRAERHFSDVWPQTLSAELGWFLGAVTGDCIVRSNQVEFRVEDRAPDLKAHLISVLKELFSVDVTEVPSKTGPVTHVRANSARLVRWLEENFGIGRKKENRKFVPEQIFRSPRSVVANYLSALYDANGTTLIPKSPTASVSVRFAIYSESQIRGVAELLRLLGLPSAVRSERRDVKRDGSPADSVSFKWELRTAASDDPQAYAWLESREPFKARHLDQFHPPVAKAACQEGLQYIEVTEVVPDGESQVMDVDVPGPQAFNVNGLYVHNCSFCALSYRQKPYRQRSPEYMVKFSKELLKNTGGIHIAPFGPDFPMHTQKKRLIRDLLENVTDDIDASSMRVDDFIADPSYILLQAHGGMDTVTLGLEGNSQRMRDFVGKGASDASVKEAVARGIAAGIKKFKLYMIASLPGEEDGDVYRILVLAKELADIRDSLGSQARLQFSWTPMLIEGNTPFQWFAPTGNNYALGDVWEELRDLKIDFKLGGKAQPDKLAYYQLTQRASREVGKALVEAARSFNAGCWGGAPKGLYAAVEERLRANGFLNGMADCYDERIKSDLFGWEFIDQGINVELLWQTYQQMVEFLEETDAETYDRNFGDDYLGNEWIQRCDSACLGKTCGVCNAKDLKIRRNYIQGATQEVDIDLTNVKVVDQRSVAAKVRLKVVKSEAKRFVTNDHFRYALRRAANRVGLPHAKRSWKFASDAMRFRDWTSGVDYVEFGLSVQKYFESVKFYVQSMNKELGDSIQIVDFHLLPLDADSLRTDVDLSLFEMELDVSPEETSLAIEKWFQSDYIPMVFHKQGQLGVTREEVNGREYVDDMWLVRDGHRLLLRTLVRGKANPYIVYASLFGRPSWIDAAKSPAIRLEAFIESDPNEVDFFRPTCESCGQSIPINPLDQPYHAHLCPRCLDKSEGRFFEGLVSHGAS